MAPKEFRFAIGGETRRASGLWRAWVQEDDFHLQVSGASHPLEFTAYKTGRWRIESSGNVSRWTRPREFRPGWTRGPDLLIPATSLLLKAEAAGPAIAWLTPPAPQHLARVSIFFAAIRSSEYPWQPTDSAGTTRLALLSLRSTGEIHLCRRDEPQHPDDVADTAPGSEGAPGSLAVVVSADRAGLPSLLEVVER